MKEMKIISVFLLFTVLILGLSSCKNNNQNTGGDFNINNPVTAENPSNIDNSDELPTIDFNETEYNFGVVIKGEKVAHSFVFKNNGKSNLIISNVKASCGCTVPKWPKEPIKPGETGYIELVFDSANRDGKQTKSANVYSNTLPNSTELIIRCDIVN